MQTKAREKEATMSTTPIKRRELAHRSSNGIDVSLYWDEIGDMLSLEVYAAKSDELFELDVPRDRALDAFHHPYAYLAAAEARTTAALLAA
jgi:hypothetical protein